MIIEDEKSLVAPISEIAEVEESARHASFPSMLTTALRRTALASATARARHLSLLASIDQGTSSSRVILYDASTLQPVASHQIELQSATTNPQAGWSQMDPLAIVSTTKQSAEGALKKAGATASDVVGVGITNQRESTIIWDKTTGKPLYDAVLWHDARTAGTVAELTPALGGQDALRGVCGLPISTYFSGIKLRWLLDNVPEVKAVCIMPVAKLLHPPRALPQPPHRSYARVLSPPPPGL